MADGRSENQRMAGAGRWATAMASLVVGAAFFGL
jgi:hypothetical protein